MIASTYASLGSLVPMKQETKKNKLLAVSLNTPPIQALPPWFTIGSSIHFPFQDTRRWISSLLSG